MTAIIIEPGDTLWSLAKRHLGDHYRWPELWAINERAILDEQRKRRWHEIPEADWIFPGTVLLLPPK